ncbi:Major Facilitator Superfamily [Geosmithia morbida]|uniref:Major Facilitator Superfamily n=1 Tax=Geosmithia morbida TaxID=1094350 RepID=A0A9P5CY21_9HYPO|nr:Major Facilitator Superfamily [Geosmithia morbida]KAF4119913.1 Major Facilitator Superfamily [Geosmithia morbida]
MAVGDQKDAPLKGSVDPEVTSAGQSTTDRDSQDGSSSTHIFSDPTVANWWRKRYEDAEYENRHRFDPSYTWKPEEERKLLRKIDLRIMTWTWLMFTALDIHRRNINRAISDNMLPELGMDTNHFNYGQTIFLVSFLAAELPSGLISKKVGADRWIPFILAAASILAGSQAFIHNQASFYVIKCLMGLTMGGFIPYAFIPQTSPSPSPPSLSPLFPDGTVLLTMSSDMILWLTYFYKSNELPVRLACFWTALSFSNIIDALIAAGVLQMRGIQGWSGWRWLFLLEGLVTLVIGILSWGMMPAGPCQTRSWFRGKNGWFTDHEESIMVNRLLRDDPSKGDMNNRQGVNGSKLVAALSDWEQWPLYLIGLTAYIPPSPPSTYISYILREIGFSVFHANLLVMPSQVLFAINLVILSWVSVKFKERAIVSSVANIWMLPFLIALVALSNPSHWLRYGLLTGILSYPYCHAIVAGWNAKNSNSVRTRAVSAALYNMAVQAGNIVGVNIYRDDDAPLYRRGNKVILSICCFNIVLLFAVKAFYIWRNKIRDERWNAMTKEEQEDYSLNTTDEGMKRLDFRFSH